MIYSLIMKKFILLVFFSFTINSYSQSYLVTYDMDQLAKEINLKTNIKTYLKGNNKNSVYIEDFMNAFSESPDNVFSIKAKQNPIYFKELGKKTITYNDHIRLKFFDIKDSISSYNWTLHNESKKILNYNCQKATCSFRGRNFTVYFTNELPFSDGPWKFFGLPGLILEVNSDDSIATITLIAEKIELKNENIAVENLYKNKKIISIDEYIKLYIEQYNKSLSYVVNENGETRPMSKGFIEYYIN